MDGSGEKRSFGENQESGKSPGFCRKALEVRRPRTCITFNLVNSTAWTRDTSILAWTKAENKGRYDSSPSLGQRNVVFNSVVFVSNSRFQLNRAVACPTSPKASRAAKDQNNVIAAVIAPSKPGPPPS